MRRRALLARTALLPTAAGLAGCARVGDRTDPPTGSPTSTPTATPATVRTPDTDTFDVIEHDLTRSNDGGEDELVAVDAVIENAGESAVAGVRALARFVGDDGELLDESEASTDRVAAGGRWTVELTYPGSGADARAVTDYRLVVELVD
ncbi:MAG: FxLYD domain-containing protein [Halolamina sp.]